MITSTKTILAVSLFSFFLFFQIQKPFPDSTEYKTNLEKFKIFNPVPGTFHNYMDTLYGKTKWVASYGPEIRTPEITDASDQTVDLRFELNDYDIEQLGQSIRRKLYEQELKYGVEKLEFYVKKIDMLVEVGKGYNKNITKDGNQHYEIMYTSEFVYPLASFEFSEAVLPGFSLRYRRPEYFRLAPVLHIYNSETQKLLQVVLLQPHQTRILKTHLCAHCQWILK